jgi:hypothetical protein
VSIQKIYQVVLGFSAAKLKVDDTVVADHGKLLETLVVLAMMSFSFSSPPQTFRTNKLGYSVLLEFLVNSNSH